MKSRLLLPFLILVLFVVLSPFIFYSVNEDEQMVVLQFGKPVRVIVNRVTDEHYAEIADEILSSTVEKVRIARGAGLYMKTPFIQTLKRYEARLLEYDEGPTDILMGDKYQLKIDSYARWRVRNPFRFLRRVQEEQWAENRLRDIISSALRKELGRHNHFEIIRSTTRPIEVSSLLEDDFRAQQAVVETGREVILERVTKICDLAARQYGIQVTDVRVKRVDLPEENANSVYKRMMEERKRIATRYINEGSREAQKMTSDTDRQVKIIKATAERTNLEIRGNADAEAARIYSEGFTEKLADGSIRKIEGFGADPDFFRFTRKLQALRKAVGPGERLILSTDSPVLDLFNAQEAAAPPSPGGP